MFIDFYKKEKNGSALLITVLVISAILTSAFYISVLSMRQMSEAVSVDRAVISFYAAEGSNEQAIYKLKNNLYTNISELNGQLFMLGSSASITRQVLDQSDSIITGLNKDNIFQFDIFDPDNLQSGSQLSKLSISWEDDCYNSSWIEFTENEWSSSGGQVNWEIDPNSPHIKKSLFNLSDTNLNNITDIGGATFDPSKSYQFRLKAMFCNIKNLKIMAYKQDGDILPFKNVFNITSIAEYPAGRENANKQALSVSFKRSDTLSGLFDYVIFSEKTLVKDVGSYQGSLYGTEFYIAEPDSLSIPIGVPYSHSLLLVNGTAPFLCSSSGSFPLGISFDNSKCEFSGTAISEGSWFVYISAYDSAGNMHKDKQIRLVVE